MKPLIKPPPKRHDNTPATENRTVNLSVREKNDHTKTRNQKNTRHIVLANQKGGVGKTTTAINLSTALAAIGQTVLLIDLDPQGNAATGLGIACREGEISSYDVLTQNKTLRAAIRTTDIPKLYCVPANMDLLGAELELSQHPNRTFLLRHALNTLKKDEEKPQFDYVFIDCPPSLNLLTINAMAAADDVLVPLQCEFFALQGLSQLLSTIEKMKRNVNPTLDIQGIVLTMFDKRNTLSHQVAQDVQEVLGDKVYYTRIPRNIRLSEAPSHGKPALIYDRNCAGSNAYIKLASELIRRERKKGRLTRITHNMRHEHLSRNRAPINRNIPI